MENWINKEQDQVLLTAQKMKFSIKDFFSKSDQIHRFLRISFMENFIFCAVVDLTRNLRALTRLIGRAFWTSSGLDFE